MDRMPSALTSKIFEVDTLGEIKLVKPQPQIPPVPFTSNNSRRDRLRGWVRFADGVVVILSESLSALICGKAAKQIFHPYSPIPNVIDVGSVVTFVRVAALHDRSDLWDVFGGIYCH